MTDDQKTDDKDELQAKIKAAKQEDEVKEEAIFSANDAKDEKESKIEELTEALARSMADLQNFKRRNEEEKASFVKFANAELLKALMPIFDHFDRSTDHLPEDLKENDWCKGVMHIHDDLMKTLEKLGIQKIKTIGEKLNPNLHEALIAGPGEKDVITEEFEAGYTYQGETIKVAKVKVGEGSK